MKVGFVGYRNQAKRLMSLVDGLDFKKEFLVYYPDINKLHSNFDGKGINTRVNFSSALNELLDTDAIFIAAPTNTHFYYLDILQKEYGGYVFCEKPPCNSMDELSKISNMGDIFKQKVFFNFCFRYSEFAQVCKSAIVSGDYGAPISLSFRNSHGLAFKPEFTNNWRNLSKNIFESILGNVGIHYVDLTLYLLGEGKKIYSYSSRKSPYTRYEDSVLITIETANGLPTTIFLSYACPFEDCAKLVLSDAIIEFNNGILSIRTPRECFDKSGLFAPPPSKKLAVFSDSREYYNTAIANAISEFFSMVKNSSKIPANEFLSAIDSTKFLLELDGRDAR